MRTRSVHLRAFSLVELLVVIGIIAILIGLLLPVLARVQAAARVVQCQSNMRQVGQSLFMYANTNNGWLIPMDPDPSAVGGLRGFGTLWPVDQRWPMRVFKINTPNPPTSEPADYVPKVMACPTDEQPQWGFTYELNNPTAINAGKQGSGNYAGLSSSDIVLAVEKLSSARDYYFEPNEGDMFNSLCIDRHGTRKGSNYLFVDGHVELKLFKDKDAAKAFLDPWTTRGVGISSEPQ